MDEPDDDIEKTCVPVHCDPVEPRRIYAIYTTFDPWPGRPDQRLYTPFVETWARKQEMERRVADKMYDWEEEE